MKIGKWGLFRNIISMLKIPQWRAFLVVAGLNVLLTYPVFFTVYKWYPIQQFPQDAQIYISLSQNMMSSEVVAPFRHRILTPLMANQLSVLPGWNTRIASYLEPRVQTLFFYFMGINYFWILATSALLFYWFRHCLYLSSGVSYLGSVALMLSYPMMSNGYIPMMDAGAHFFITLLLIFFYKKQWKWAVFFGMLGALQKETVIVVAGIWGGLLYATRGQWRLFITGILVLLPGIVVFEGLMYVFPADSCYPPLLGAQLLDFPARFILYLFSSDMLTQVVFANIGLVLGGVGHLWLRARAVKIQFPMVWLLIWPVLFAISVILNIGPGNAGRICGFGLPIYLAYQLTVLDAWLQIYGTHFFDRLQRPVS